MILVIMVGAEWEEKEEKLESTHPYTPQIQNSFSVFFKAAMPKQTICLNWFICLYQKW